jgi:hypothetical protein
MFSRTEQTKIRGVQIDKQHDTQRSVSLIDSISLVVNVGWGLARRREGEDEGGTGKGKETTEGAPITANRRPETARLSSRSAAQRALAACIK